MLMSGLPITMWVLHVFGQNGIQRLLMLLKRPSECERVHSVKIILKLR